MYNCSNNIFVVPHGKQLFPRVVFPSLISVQNCVALQVSKVLKKNTTLLSFKKLSLRALVLYLEIKVLRIVGRKYNEIDHDSTGTLELRNGHLRSTPEYRELVCDLGRT